MPQVYTNIMTYDVVSCSYNYLS